MACRPSPWHQCALGSIAMRLPMDLETAWQSIHFSPLTAFEASRMRDAAKPRQASEDPAWQQVTRLLCQEAALRLVRLSSGSATALATLSQSRRLRARPPLLSSRCTMMTGRTSHMLSTSQPQAENLLMMSSGSSVSSSSARWPFTAFTAVMMQSATCQPRALP